jgi:hypothetical protein
MWAQLGLSEDYAGDEMGTIPVPVVPQSNQRASPTYPDGYHTNPGAGRAELYLYLTRNKLR